MVYLLRSVTFRAKPVKPGSKPRKFPKQTGRSINRSTFYTFGLSLFSGKRVLTVLIEVTEP